MGGEDRNVEGLIPSYELAIRMRMEAPLFDLTKESKQTLDLDGIVKRRPTTSEESA